MAEQTSSTTLPQPLRTTASALSKVPGAGTVGRAAGGALDAIGSVSPRGRRIAVYTGAGVLGVTGLVEWPVAVTGAAVAWLTQPRPHEARAGETPESRSTAADRQPAAQKDTLKGGSKKRAAAKQKAMAKKAKKAKKAGKTSPGQASTARPGSRSGS
ncbi:hypothetical protein [Streptomyces sp. NPDC003635]